ncbi:gamma carbonic anhydrase family protein [Alkalilimnicola sp. S0819]|uniref:gamma carbonic anhydrase family protein n=1 Tax=Alkalilimnicola sp. S0819 TaxID=2613922 RepID=UPI001261A64E|nr:gamma carbonic anhydrase family protein [Alkalilimnicola sp. S0819]KAB7624287.1 gamma carbonic anhydrase family protein [Alkalilimnicola sp. S0819]MPQ16111.1 gamma carbonic anhydrase family protein [Alkalilimnicola sp. S0819]
MLEPFDGITPSHPASAWVHDSAVLIGDVELGEDCSVWPLVVIRGDVNYVRIGARSNVQDGTVIHVAHKGPYNPTGFPTLVGEDVTIGHKAVVHACTIGNRVLVGMGAVIMDGAEVGDDCIIGANALVPPGKKLAGGHLYVGSPVKAARALSDEEKEQLRYSAAHYVRLKNRYTG